MYMIRYYAEMGRLVRTVRCPHLADTYQHLGRVCCEDPNSFLYAVCYGPDGSDVWKFDQYQGRKS